MCWATRCCYFIRLDWGSIIIGAISLIFSAAMTISSAVFLGYHFEQLPQNSSLTIQGGSETQARLKILSFELSVSTIKILLSSALALGIMLLLASILLMLGIAKRKPGYILYYFGFGIFFAIFSLLAGLLLLIQQHWIAALIVYGTALIYIHFLTVIHSLYNAFVKGKFSGYLSDSLERLFDDNPISTNPEEI